MIDFSGAMVGVFIVVKYTKKYNLTTTYRRKGIL
jgi:hypothetical protein